MFFTVPKWITKGQEGHLFLDMGLVMKKAAIFELTVETCMIVFFYCLK